jgi:hypothetical protein
MSKGNDTTRSVATAEPWSGVSSQLKSAVGKAQNMYGNGQAPGYYPGQGIAPMSGYTQGALDWQAQRAMAGSPLTQAGQNQLTSTLRGDYLNAGNPAFQGAVNSAIRPVTEQYQNVVMPGIMSQFSDAGRYGSGAMNGQGGAMEQANNSYMRNVGDISSNMAYQNYSDERGNMLKAGLLAPEMAQQDYHDISQLGMAGQGIDSYNQAQINEDKNKYNFNANKDWNYLSNYMGLLQQAPWGSTTTSTPPSPNPFTSGLGGAFAGGALGSASPGLGTGLGALLGGGAGILGSFF